MKALTEPQFNYCPLNWMFHPRTANNKLNRIRLKYLKELCPWCFPITLPLLMNCLGRINHFQLTIGTSNVYPLKFSSSLMVFLQVNMKNIFHLKTDVLYILRSRIELYCRNPKTVKKMEQKLYLAQHLKYVCIPLRGNAVCNLFIFSYCTANFLTKFCSSDPSFNRNILTSLYLKSKHLRMRNYAITHLYILYTSFTTWCQLETYIEDTVNKWYQQTMS